MSNLRVAEDIVPLSDFKARDKPQAAERWIGEKLNAIERTTAFPASGRIVPEIDHSNIREVILDNYRVVYQRGETLTYPTGSP